MDPASIDSLCSALQAQERCIQNQEENTNAALQELARCATCQEQVTAELREMIKNLTQRPTDLLPPTEEPAPPPPTVVARIPLLQMLAWGCQRVLPVSRAIDVPSSLSLKFTLSYMLQDSPPSYPK